MINPFGLYRNMRSCDRKVGAFDVRWMSAQRGPERRHPGKGRRFPVKKRRTDFGFCCSRGLFEFDGMVFLLINFSCHYLRNIVGDASCWKLLK